MMKIKILGSGCFRCKNTFNLIQKVVQESGLQVDISKEERLSEILKYGIVSTPAVVINERVIHSGSVPASIMIKKWLEDELPED